MPAASPFWPSPESRARYPMAENGGARSLIDHFAVLADPRQSWKVVYPLPEVLLLVLCGTLAGAEDFVEIRRWGMVNQGFLRRFLPSLRASRATIRSTT